MGQRIYNFSAGPAVLPESVLKKASEALTCYKESGIGICEMSHRSKDFSEVIETAKSNFKKLLNIGDDYEVLFLHGGASLQFYMIPLNFEQSGSKCYINTGMWSKKAITEAKRFGEVNIIASSEDNQFKSIPSIEENSLPSDAAYCHFTSNNTIYGTQFFKEPISNGIPLVCDASSDFLSREIDIDRYGMIYAGAQKNLGPAGLAVVVMKKNFLEQAGDDLPPMLSYKNHADKGSLFNTPPAFPIFVVGLVLEWILEQGGLKQMQVLNKDKAGILYDYLDGSSFYEGIAQKDSRSLMNVTFKINDSELEKTFIADALKAGLSGLKGHRSIGGCRASIYNAFPKEGVEKLVSFMDEFAKSR